MKKEYTQADLNEVSRRYSDNVDKLMEAEVGSAEWGIYRREERRLNDLDIAIRKSLGIFIVINKNGKVILRNSICKVCNMKFLISKRKGKDYITYCSDWCQQFDEAEMMKKRDGFEIAPKAEAEVIIKETIEYANSNNIERYDDDAKKTLIVL